MIKLTYHIVPVLLFAITTISIAQSTINDINVPYKHNLELGFGITSLLDKDLYSWHFEYERKFNKVDKLTYGLSLDLWNNYPSITFINPGSATTFPLGQIKRNLMRVNFRWYPLSIKGVIRQSPYIGIGPCYHYITLNGNKFLYGPGIGSSIGFQYFISKRINLSIESVYCYYYNSCHQERFADFMWDWTHPILKIGINF